MKRPPKPQPAVFQQAQAGQKLSPIRYVPYKWNPKRVATSGRKPRFTRRPVPTSPFCSATYAAIEQTCSEQCPLKRAPDGTAGGCFADSGFTRGLIKRMNEAAAGMTGFEVTMEEVFKIDGAFVRGVPQDGFKGRGRDLRLHVGGDARTPGAAALLGEAAARWKARGGGSVWTYTHSWREISRAAWGPDITVLTSVHTAAEIAQARRRGYAAAITVEEFASTRAYDVGLGERMIPCPAETSKTTCVQCRLCIDRDLLGLNVSIGFEMHGDDAEQGMVRLQKLYPLRTARAKAAVR